LWGLGSDMTRAGSKGSQGDLYLPPQEDRLYYDCGHGAETEGWYFRCREGIIGPYPLRSTAIRMLLIYVRFCSSSSKRTLGGVSGQEVPSVASRHDEG
jgi:hypothetical protein